jgi:hypothetical protein
MNTGRKRWIIGEGWIPPLGDETISLVVNK